MLAQPTTGRRHQIRRHLKHLAHPIIGDATHGKGPLNRWWAERLGLQRLWLHAWRLQLPHPAHGRLITLDSGLRWPPAAQDAGGATPAGLATRVCPAIGARLSAAPARYHGPRHSPQPAMPAPTATAARIESNDTDLPLDDTLCPGEAMHGQHLRQLLRAALPDSSHHKAAGWFGQTDFLFTRHHVDEEQDSYHDGLFITLWKLGLLAGAARQRRRIGPWQTCSPRPGPGCASPRSPCRQTVCCANTAATTAAAGQAPGSRWMRSTPAPRCCRPAPRPGAA